MRKAIFGIRSIRAMPLTPIPTRSYWPMPSEIKEALKPKGDGRFINPFFLGEQGSSEHKPTQALINEMKHSGSRQLAPHRISVLMYHMMREEVADPFMTKVFSENLRKFRPDDFQPMSFIGMLIAAYTTNAYPKEFVERVQEMMTLQQNFYFNPTYLHRLLAAMNKSTQISKDQLYTLIDLKIKPTFLEEWTQKYETNRKILPSIADELVRLEYKDEEVWTKILESLEQKAKGFTGYQRVIRIMENLRTLNDMEGFFKKGKLDDLIAIYEKKARSNPESNWRYNFEERRYNTWDEMVAQRDRYSERDFMRGLFSRGFTKDVIKKEQQIAKKKMQRYAISFFTWMKKENKDRYEKDAEYRKMIDDELADYQKDNFWEELVSNVKK
eukprot:CAMPEP_0115024102 /NCGR_PEP_ID=MMETSP0216-20121206/32938_1 /TAXON_ID=223996 /ORGANISM="Protocruzia adherens, Strain Boccale" /LENGTH=383 /DNA_ID=CAMNT_0002397897 /DNA_START=114 /DNA_END=1265 /DNA_ORIENTATION=+